MSSARTKLVSARLTDAEYAAVERAAGADTISAWARTALVHAARPPPPVTPPVEWNTRGTPVEQDWKITRPPRRNHEDRRAGAPPPDEHAAAARHGTASDGTSRAERRANPTARWAWDPALGTSRPLTRSAAWLPTIVVLACLTAGGIAASQYAHASTDESWLGIAQPALFLSRSAPKPPLTPSTPCWSSAPMAMAAGRAGSHPKHSREGQAIMEVCGAQDSLCWSPLRRKFEGGRERSASSDRDLNAIPDKEDSPELSPTGGQRHI
jgi:hypothetical protein